MLRLSVMAHTQSKRSPNIFLFDFTLVNKSCNHACAHHCKMQTHVRKRVRQTCGHNLVSQPSLMREKLLRVSRPDSRRFGSEEVISVGVSILLLEIEQRFVVDAEYDRRGQNGAKILRIGGGYDITRLGGENCFEYLSPVRSCRAPLLSGAACR